MVRIEIRKELKAGFVELSILIFLSEQDMYGYEISQMFETRSNGKIEVKEGTLYPILYRLEEKHVIESYWETVKGRGKPRKYYRLTSVGCDYLKQYRDEWLTIAHFMDQIFWT